MKKHLSVLMLLFAVSAQAESFAVLNADAEIQQAEQVCIDSGWNYDSCKRAVRDDLISELTHQVYQRRMDLYTSMTEARLITLESTYIARDNQADLTQNELISKINDCRQWYRKDIYDFNDYNCILNGQKAVIDFQVKTYNELLSLIRTELGYQ